MLKLTKGWTAAALGALALAAGAVAYAAGAWHFGAGNSSAGLSPAASGAPAAAAPNAAGATLPATKPATPSAREPFDSITDEEIKQITYEDCDDDSGIVGPVAKNLDRLDDDARKRFEDFVSNIDSWKPANVEEVGQKVRNVIALACMADIAQSEFEGETAYAVFDRLEREVPKSQLEKACAWVVLKPDEATVPTSAADLGFDQEVDEAQMRERSQLYAKKLLGRLLGKLPVKHDDNN